MIKNDIEIQGLITEDKLKLLNKSDFIIKSLDSDLSLDFPIKSIYEIKLSTNLISKRKVELKDSFLTIITAKLNLKILYSEQSTNRALFAEKNIPILYNIDKNIDIDNIEILDLNLIEDNKNYKLNFIFMLLKQNKSDVKMYTLDSRYINNSSKDMFNSSLDFL